VRGSRLNEDGDCDGDWADAAPMWDDLVRILKEVGVAVRCSEFFFFESTYFVFHLIHTLSFVWKGTHNIDINRFDIPHIYKINLQYSIEKA